jgi:hypothetical protein
MQLIMAFSTVSTFAESGIAKSLSTKVHVYVSADEKIKGQIESYIVLSRLYLLNNLD